MKYYIISFLNPWSTIYVYVTFQILNVKDSRSRLQSLKTVVRCKGTPHLNLKKKTLYTTSYSYDIVYRVISSSNLDGECLWLSGFFFPLCLCLFGFPGFFVFVLFCFFSSFFSFFSSLLWIVESITHVHHQNWLSVKSWSLCPLKVSTLACPERRLNMAVLRMRPYKPRCPESSQL